MKVAQSQRETKINGSPCQTHKENKGPSKRESTTQTMSNLSNKGPKLTMGTFFPWLKPWAHFNLLKLTY